MDTLKKIEDGCYYLERNAKSLNKDLKKFKDDGNQDELSDKINNIISHATTILNCLELLKRQKRLQKMKEQLKSVPEEKRGEIGDKINSLSDKYEEISGMIDLYPTDFWDYI